MKFNHFRDLLLQSGSSGVPWGGAQSSPYLTWMPVKYRDSIQINLIPVITLPRHHSLSLYFNSPSDPKTEPSTSSSGMFFSSEMIYPKLTPKVTLSMLNRVAKVKNARGQTLSICL